MMMSNSSAQGAPTKSFTPETLMEIYRISGAELSPSGNSYLYSRSLPDVRENRINSEVLVGTVGRTGDARVLPIMGHSATFLDDETIAYISTSGAHAQVAIIKVDGTGQRALSDFAFDVTGFLFSPNRERIVVIREVELPKITQQEYPELDKVSGRIMDDLMYKHWDVWVDYAPQPFLAEVSPSLEISTDLTPILGEGSLHEAPIMPFSGMEQFSWSPNNNQLVYSSKKKVGLDYAVSTNTDLYLYDIPTGETTNLTEGMMGYDTNPIISPDGRTLAWLSMEHDGYEADLPRLFTVNLATGEKRELSSGYEYYMQQIAWTEDGTSIRFLAPEQGLPNLFDIETQSGFVTRLTQYEMDDVTSFSGSGKRIIYGLQSMRHPTDLYVLDLQKGAQPVKLTIENDALLADIPNIEVEKRWITTTDGKQMLTWVVLPPNFDPEQKYPAILYCQGGPQSTVSQFWSYRWNLRTFASQGYIMVAPNRRGVPGFGKEWNEQISRDWGGQNMKDLLTAIDVVAKEPYVDEERLGATGASYGGYTVYWLAGHHEGRFKSFAAHAGIFNFDAQYLETEEKFFADWDMGGAYWDKDNPAVQHTYANSPHLFVDKWDTPILITHGNRDYRILASQGMQAFDAAKLRGIPARMLYFPDENHWILQPQNGVLFYKVWTEWMDRWLK